jgi:hypothetical protein
MRTEGIEPNEKILDLASCHFLLPDIFLNWGKKAFFSASLKCTPFPRNYQPSLLFSMMNALIPDDPHRNHRNVVFPWMTRIITN